MSDVDWLLLFLWIPILLSSNLILYISNNITVFKITLWSKYIGIGFFFLYGFLRFDQIISFEVNILFILLPLALFIYFEKFAYINKSFVDPISIDQKREKLDDIIDKQSEVVLIDFNKQDEWKRNEIHIIPSIFLESREFSIKFKSSKNQDIHTRYFLTFCVLCNSIHAYQLPIIAGREMEINSGNGYVLNGNKILMTKDMNYIWQQLTGEGINEKARPLPLKEYKLIRTTWEHVRNFENAYVIISNTRPLSFYFMRIVRFAVSKIPFFGFDSRKSSTLLPRKAKVVGVNLLMGGSKAYPKTLFPPNEVTILEDSIETVSFSIVSNGFSTYGFKETGLSLEKGLISKNENNWTIDGRSTGSQPDLEMMHITDNIYWYLWAQFYPKTVVFQKD